ncbi:MAG: AMP-binding protein [Gemmatimonadetes bacterium]|nr:AMP-binding protein [Gemmatimonadota bacterium]
MTTSVSNFALDVVDRHARQPGRVALRWQNAGGYTTDVTFLDMKIRSEKVACVLRNHGVRPGQRVFILLPLCTAWWESVLGCMRAGAVAVLGQDASTSQVLKDQINQSRSTLVIASDAVADVIGRIMDDCSRITHWLSVGWEREGWVDFDRRVSLAPAGFNAVETHGSDPCIVVYDQGSPATETTHCHGDERYDLEQLDAWRDGLAIALQEVSEQP